MPGPQRALNSRAIKERLLKLTDPLDLLREYSTNGHAYDKVNLATSWSRLGRAHGRSISLIRADGGQRLYPLRERTVQDVECF
jgi:hypothetical protein